MPIQGTSDIRRMPRLGKIHLGIKIKKPEKNPYPRATNYFVVPDEIKEYVGSTPKMLPIMFPTEKVDEFAQQWLRCYSFTQGLICKGDGRTATRKVDVETGAIASHTTQEWVFKECPCNPDTCPEYIGDAEKGIKPQCRRVINLLFLMPSVPGVGVWQLDTSSFYSIANINSCVDLIRRICGRISFIPLTLSLPPERVLLPALAEEEAPEDLYPQETAGPEAQKETPPPELEEKTPNDVIEDDVPDLDAVFRIAWHFWQMQPVEVCGQLGYKTTMDLYEAKPNPWDSFLTIKGYKQPEE